MVSHTPGDRHPCAHPATPRVQTLLGCKLLVLPVPGVPGCCARRDPQIFLACPCCPTLSPNSLAHPNIAWLGVCVCFCCFFSGITTDFEYTSVSHSPSTISPFSQSPFFYVKPRGQTEITSPDSLRKSCPNCNTALLSSLLPKVCVSLDSFAVFSLVVWVFSSLLCHAASQLISVISAVSLAMGRHQTL